MNQKEIQKLNEKEMKEQFKISLNVFLKEGSKNLDDHKIAMKIFGFKQATIDLYLFLLELSFKSQHIYKTGKFIFTDEETLLKQTHIKFSKIKRAFRELSEKKLIKIIEHEPTIKQIYVFCSIEVFFQTPTGKIYKIIRDSL